MKHYGIGYAAWAIFMGMLLSNTIGTPKWVKPALQVEFYIKTGLVLLGAEVLFNKIIAIGVPGIFVAWVVTPIVLISTYIFGQKVLKIPSKTLNITISADMSVCGTSAAIATAAACRAKKEELTLSIGLSLVFTSIMMIIMPAFIKAVGMPYILGGAWMGGTIDATGAVAAAGAFLSEKALYVAATIKMIQNVAYRRYRIRRGGLLVYARGLRTRRQGALDGNLAPFSQVCSGLPGRFHRVLSGLRQPGLGRRFHDDRSGRAARLLAYLPRLVLLPVLCSNRTGDQLP